jgi:cbb3-type cytochrome oxidase maturation protein
LKGFIVENSLIMLIILSLLLGAGCWLVFVWAVKRGEFDDTERPKYRMLDDEDEDEGNDDD